MKESGTGSSSPDAVRALTGTAAPSIDGEGLAQACVVVAEDDRSQREMMGMMLELRGFRVILTKDGHEAFAAVTANQPDALVSDMNMPVLDGLGLIRSVRASVGGRTVPIVLWSGLGDDDARVREAAAYECVTVIGKASVVTTVGTVLHQLLDPSERARNRHHQDANGTRAPSARGFEVGARA